MARQLDMRKVVFAMKNANYSVYVLMTLKYKASSVNIHTSNLAVSLSTTKFHVPKGVF